MNNNLRRSVSGLSKIAAAACMMATVAFVATGCGEDKPEPEGKVPSVATTSIEDGATDVALEAGEISIRWSTPIDIVDATKITISPSVTPFEVGAGANIATIAVTHGALQASTQYTLAVGAGAVKAKTGGKQNEAFNFSFTTFTPPELPTPNPDISGALVFDIDPALTNPNAGPEAAALYERFKGWFGEKTLTGSMAQYTVGTESNDWIVENTGLNTAIACFDFMNVNRQEKWANWDRPYSELIDNAIAWDAAGGLVSCMWHWRDPSGASDEFYCKPDTGRPTYSGFDASDIFDPDSEGYKQMMDEIDFVSEYLAQLQDAGIPVLWRPLHEAQGNRDEWGGAWFWWGNGSGDRAAACVELWRVMYDRMVNVNGLDNLIWVWTNSITGLPQWYHEGITWYPGDEFVDIIGIDIYDANQTAGRASHIDQFKKTAHTAGLRKMVALTECGYIPSADGMHSEGDVWLWYMPWNDNFTRDPAYNGNYWATAFADPRILTREDL